MKVPESVREIVGNRRILTALTRGRCPSSALFEGPEGVGKRTLALLLARLANCRNPQTDEGRPCGRCPSCLKAKNGNHPDIQVVEPVDSIRIRIDQMRTMCQEAQFRPFEGRARFFIVDPADMMQPEAAHAILKTLEEPPESSHIFLITAYPDQLLPTIRSRCLIFPFRPLVRMELAELLRTRAQDVDEPELRAGFSHGSVGRAISLDLERLLADRDLMLDLLSDWFSKRRFGTVLKHTSRKEVQTRDRAAVLRYLGLLQDLCYDVYYLCVETPDRVINVDQMARLRRLEKATTVAELRELLESIGQAKRDIDRNVKVDMCFETLWLFNETPRSLGVY